MDLDVAPPLDPIAPPDPVPPLALAGHFPWLPAVTYSALVAHLRAPVRDAGERSCVWCGEPFMPLGARRACCSSVCSAKLRQRRKADAAKRCRVAQRALAQVSL